MIIIPVTCGIKGRILSAKVVGPDGVVKFDTGEFDNLVTNFGLDALCSTTSFRGFLQVGTGSTAPAYTDTTLVSRLAGVATSLSSCSWNTSTGVVTTVLTAAFNPGTATGNLTELGLAPAATGSVTTRALFMSGGSPVTITVGASDSLIVTYSLTLTIPLDTAATITESISSTSYNINIRPIVTYTNSTEPVCFGGNAGTVVASAGGIAQGTYPGALPAAFSGFPTGTPVSAATGATSHTNGTNYVDCTVTIAAGHGVQASVQSIVMGNGSGGTSGSAPNYSGFSCNFGIGFSPAFAFPTTVSLTLTVRTTWSRA